MTCVTCEYILYKAAGLGIAPDSELESSSDKIPGIKVICLFHLSDGGMVRVVIIGGAGRKSSSLTLEKDENRPERI